MYNKTLLLFCVVFSTFIFLNTAITQASNDNALPPIYAATNTAQFKTGNLIIGRGLTVAGTSILNTVLTSRLVAGFYTNFPTKTTGLIDGASTTPEQPFVFGVGTTCINCEGAAVGSIAATELCDHNGDNCIKVDDIVKQADKIRELVSSCPGLATSSSACPTDSMLVDGSCVPLTASCEQLGFAGAGWKCDTICIGAHKSVSNSTAGWLSCRTHDTIEEFECWKLPSTYCAIGIGGCERDTVLILPHSGETYQIPSGLQQPSGWYGDFTVFTENGEYTNRDRRVKDISALAPGIYPIDFQEWDVGSGKCTNAHVKTFGKDAKVCYK